MTERYDAVSARKYTDRDGNEKTAFLNIGVAFKMKDRDGYSLRLHAMPAPTDGEYTVLLFPPKPREERQGQARQQPAQDRDDPRTQGGGRELDDEIPFAPEWRL